MRDYHEHTDTDGLARRLRVLASHADRATMLRILEERDIGCVTLTMRKDELRARLSEGRRAFNYGHMDDSRRIGFDAYGRKMGWSK